MSLYGSVIPSDAQGGHTFRNRFINGDMRVWQRGTSFSSIGTSTFSADRWFSNYGGTAPTFSRSTDVPTGFQYSFSLAGSSTSYHGIGQRIESLNTADLSGQTVTLSFYAKLSSGTAAGGLNISAGYANSVDNFGSTTEFSGLNITSTISGSWTRYTYTFTVPSTAASNGFHVIVFCPGATQTFTLLLTGMQLERGSIATPFEFRPVGLELSLCQRYYEQDVWNAIAVNTNGTNISWAMPFRVTKRTTPTVTNSGTVTFQGIVAGVTVSSTDGTVDRAAGGASRSGTQSDAYYVTSDSGGWKATAEL
jgi:Carbohydrate binding domain